MKPIFYSLRIAIFLMLLSLMASPVTAQDSASTRTVGGVKSMEERVSHLEKAVGREVEGPCPSGIMTAILSPTPLPWCWGFPS